MTASQTFARRVSLAIDWRCERLVRRKLVRRWGSPTITEMLMEGGGVVHVDPDAFASSMSRGADLDRYRGEFDELTRDLERRRDDDHYPRLFDVERGTAWALYVHVRSQVPQHTVETGVANGISSYYILNALRKNGTGTLHSIDVGHDVGRILSNDERKGWDLRVLDVHALGRSLEGVFADLPPLDLFIHDSDHTYRWMRREFELASRQLAPGGWVTSDDADASYAFAEFCDQRHVVPDYLFDGRKIFAAVQLTC